MKNTNTKIYFACLSSYNAGVLHGVWVDLDIYSTAEEMQEQIDEMLSKSKHEPAEEWAIHDYESDCGIDFGEYESLDDLEKLQAAMSEHGEAIALFWDWSSCDLDDLVDQFGDAYHGCWDSEIDYVENYVDECMEIPDNIKHYFDYEKFARDVFINDMFSLKGSEGVHVFSRHY